jgi:hypothetical protein
MLKITMTNCEKPVLVKLQVGLNFSYININHIKIKINN